MMMNVYFDGENLCVSYREKAVARSLKFLIEELKQEVFIDVTREGDLVEIVDDTECQPVFSKWLMEYATPEQMISFAFGRLPESGWIGRVVRVEEHLYDPDEWLALVRVDFGDERHAEHYLMNTRGLRKIEESEEE